MKCTQWHHVLNNVLKFLFDSGKFLGSHKRAAEIEARKLPGEMHRTPRDI